MRARTCTKTDCRSTTIPLNHWSSSSSVSKSSTSIALLRTLQNEIIFLKSLLLLYDEEKNNIFVRSFLLQFAYTVLLSMWRMSMSSSVSNTFKKQHFNKTQVILNFHCRARWNLLPSVRMFVNRTATDILASNISCSFSICLEEKKRKTNDVRQWIDYKKNSLFPSSLESSK